MPNRKPQQTSARWKKAANKTRDWDRRCEPTDRARCAYKLGEATRNDRWLPDCFGRSAPRCDGKQGLNLSAAFQPHSGVVKYEPDRAKDQHREPGCDREQGEHRRPGLGLACLGWGFDDLIVPYRCHDTLDSLDNCAISVLAASTFRRKRLIPDQVPDFGAR